MKRLLLLCTFWLLTLPAICLAQASNVKQFCATADGTDVTITTTGETVVATLGGCTAPSNQINAALHCSGIVTTSANSTTYKMRIRRTNVSGTALGDAVAETIKVTAGGTEAYSLDATDTRNADIAGLVYVCTIEFAGADATGTSKWSYIQAILY